MRLPYCHNVTIRHDRFQIKNAFFEILSDSIYARQQRDCSSFYRNLWDFWSRSAIFVSQGIVGTRRFRFVHGLYQLGSVGKMHALAAHSLDHPGQLSSHTPIASKGDWLIETSAAHDRIYIRTNRIRPENGVLVNRFGSSDRKKPSIFR